MTFAQIPTNASVFIDANIFLYYFSPDPAFGPECRILMERICKYQDFSGYTSTHIVSEVSHQLMVLEAAQLFNWPLAGITQRLQKHPAEIKKLSRFRQAIDEVPRLGIEVLPVERHLLPLAGSLAQLHGLLTNDAITAATYAGQSDRPSRQQRRRLRPPARHYPVRARLIPFSLLFCALLSVVLFGWKSSPTNGRTRMANWIGHYLIAR